METNLFPAVSSSFGLPVWQLVLELCRGDGVANLQTIQSQLDKIHACSAELSSTEHMVKKTKKKTRTIHINLGK